MQQAADDHAADMGDDKKQAEVGEKLMHFF